MSIATSGLPIAIGTSLALESLLPPTKKPYDLSRKIPEVDKPIQYYNTVFINMYTVARNLLAATTNSYTVAELISRLRGELHWIRDYIQHISKETEVEYYTHSLSKGMLTGSSVSRLRLFTTAKSKAKNKLILAVLKGVAKDKTLGVTNHTDGIGGHSDKNGLVLTHFAMDMLRHQTHKDLHQLSSHTGLVNNREHFHKLYYQIPSKDMLIFPFNPQLWKFLGDKALVKPSPIAVRKRLYDLALTKRWSHATTLSKIKSNLRDLDLELYSIIFTSK